MEVPCHELGAASHLPTAQKSSSQVLKAEQDLGQRKFNFFSDPSSPRALEAHWRREHHGSGFGSSPPANFSNDSAE